MKQTKVPGSLHQIAELTAGGGDFFYLLGDFLDSFHRQPSKHASEENPALLATQCVDGNRMDAFLAVVAETLALWHGWNAPEWIFRPERYLRRPFFAVTASSLRATPLLESPPAFRSRNIFVTGNALSRA